MEKSRAVKLHMQIQERKEQGLLSAEQLVTELRKLARLAQKEEYFHLAFEAYQELDDKDNLRQLSQVCIEKSRFYEAYVIFDYLHDRNGLLNMMRAVETKQDRRLMEYIASSYFGQERVLALEDAFQQWVRPRGFSKAPCFSVVNLVNMAYNLAPQYDVGVGIAKAGLYFTYICTFFDLNTKVVECHRVEKGGIFRWCEEASPEQLEGKRVVVLENDVRSGRTAQRVLGELQRYNPSSIDLALVHNPVPPHKRFGTIQENIPPGYGRIHFPKDFSYSSFDKAVERLDERLNHLQKIII